MRGPNPTEQLKFLSESYDNLLWEMKPTIYLYNPISFYEIY